ncbi:MAG TPA: hypothetical protein DCG77_12170 [Sphingobacterium sp.]|nr:hypothetical protein [Sphingobacterium sp.]
MDTVIFTKLVTASKMTEILGVSRRTFQSWRDEGRIPYYLVGKSKRYLPDEVSAALLKIKVNEQSN